jgi:hypothetical protein
MILCIHVATDTTITSLIAGHTAIKDTTANSLPELMVKIRKPNYLSPVGKDKKKIKSKSKSKP